MNGKSFFLCVYIYIYTHTFVGIVCCCCCCCLVTKLSSTVCDPMKNSLPGSSVHGISQVRILEWVAMPSSRGSSWPRYLTQVFGIGRFIFYHWATRETWELYNNSFFGSNLGPIFVLNLSVYAIKYYELYIVTTLYSTPHLLLYHCHFSYWMNSVITLIFLMFQSLL